MSFDPTVHKYCPWFFHFIFHKKTTGFGHSLFLWEITFQLLRLLCLAKDHWWEFSSGNVHMVHIVNWIRFKMVYTSEMKSLYIKFYQLYIQCSMWFSLPKDIRQLVEKDWITTERVWFPRTFHYCSWQNTNLWEEPGLVARHSQFCFHEDNSHIYNTLEIGQAKCGYVTSAYCVLNVANKSTKYISLIDQSKISTIPWIFPRRRISVRVGYF